MALKPSIPTPGIPPQPTPIAPGATPSTTKPASPGRPTAERRALVVGRGIALSGGAISDCERLEVHGTAEVSIRNALELVIADSGVFRGEAEIEEADISGAFDGGITATGRLVIRSTGRVTGTIRCARLMVEEGAQVSGRIEMIPALGAPAPSATLAHQASAPSAAPGQGSAAVVAEPALARG
ncbi:MAG: polymer-forming cytoskeletal protein [Acetobacteraceae bacterium]|nr:polymer-forming cytoskeletal protein [Acetobacteraceae bacterium]